MQQHAIQIENVTKIFSGDLGKKPVKAVDGLNLTVDEGEVFAFLGANGAGKTTTIKMMTRLLFPNRGQIFIFGEKNDAPQSMERIGFLPEQPRMYDYLTGREFLNFIASLFKNRVQNKKEKVNQCIDKVGMSRYADRAIKTYSRGMVQRLGLAQSIINDPDLLILDEPMANLDPIGRKEFRDLILNLKQEGKTIFFSSHIISDAEMIADRVGIFNEGRLIQSGNLQDLLTTQDHSTEVTFKIDAPEKLNIDPKKFIRQDDRYLFCLEQQSELHALLEKIYASGGEVISVIPQKQSLEDVFISEMRQ